jgi:hypothetical protein
MIDAINSPRKYNGHYLMSQWDYCVLYETCLSQGCNVRVVTSRGKACNCPPTTLHPFSRHTTKRVKYLMSRLDATRAFLGSKCVLTCIRRTYPPPEIISFPAPIYPVQTRRATLYLPYALAAHICRRPLHAFLDHVEVIEIAFVIIARSVMAGGSHTATYAERRPRPPCNV